MVQHGAAAGAYGIAIGGNAGGADLRIFAWGSGSALDSSNWTEHQFTVDAACPVGDVQKVSNADWDGDAHPDSY